TNTKVIGNSVYTNSNAGTGRALYVTGGNIELYGNNFVNEGPGYGMYILSGVNNSDNNNSYVPNGYFGYAGSAQTTLADFQNATLMEMNSVSTDPAFPAFDDLSTCNDELDGASVSDTIVVDDINGITRSATPDIGAYEFDGVNNFSIGADSAICSSDNIVLGNPYSQSNWVWNNGFTTPSITVNTPGLYIAQINNSCGIGLDSLQLTH